MKHQLTYSGGPLCGTFHIPASKSISNRLLIMYALAGLDFPEQGLSDSDDTAVMLRALRDNPQEVNIGHAGTSMRFLTAYFTATGQSKIITGSERMKNRPIRPLVEALNQLGADIRYAEKEGFPPVVTSGRPLTGNSVRIEGSVSSQFITALLLIAPTLPDGLRVEITGTLMSGSYVDMTLSLMQQAGIACRRDLNTILIPRATYQPQNATPEADWSGASYWYELAALAPDADILLPGLSDHSVQGDSVVARLFEGLGVHTTFTPQGARLCKADVTCRHFTHHFTDCPDIVQTLAVTLCLKGIPFRLEGAQTLRVKETDRIAALQNELKKLGYTITEPEPGVLEWDGITAIDAVPAGPAPISIATYQDHRMALAFAPAAIRFPGLTIEEAGVVSKSYPTFWDDLRKAGFETILP